MSIRLLTSAEDLALYDSWIKSHADGSLWQSLEWKSYQESLGRTVRIYAVISNQLPVASDEIKILASAMVIIDKTTGGFSTWDIQRGPVGIETKDLIQKIIQDAKKDRCISIFLSPITGNWFPITGRPSARHEQPEATRILDLTQSEEEILKQMHQKGRYNIKVAEKSGVRIEKSSDTEAYAKMASETAKRDGFVGGSTKRYRAFLENIPGSFLLLAYAGHDKKPIAGLIGVMYGKAGIYYYGASDYEHRSLMAPYLLQWEAIRHCKKAGCEKYDLLGIAPPTGDRRSEIGDQDKRHPWAGISDFKIKFGGNVVTYPCEHEIVLKPVLRAILKLKRKVVG